MSIDEQKTEIQNNFPEIFDVKENVKEQRVGLPPLEGAEQGNGAGGLRGKSVWGGRRRRGEKISRPAAGRPAAGRKIPKILLEILCISN